MNRAAGRVIALIALLVLVGIALRGYLPGGEKHAATNATSNNPAAMIAIITLLAAAVAIITIAIIATLRQPRRPRQSGQPLRDSPFGERTRPSWRVLLVVVGLVLTWLVFLVLLLRMSVVIDLGHPSATTVSTTPVPSTTPAPPPASPRTPQGERGDVFRYLLAATIFMVAVWVVGFVIALRRRGRGPRPQPFEDGGEPAGQPSAPHSLAVAAERGLAEMGDLSREPREAIIACYAAMEDALSNAPEAMPRDSDTPSEVLARAIEHHAIHTGTATELVDLFAEARFSPHVMTEEHREIAVRALQNVLAELKSAV